jgi:hypothetical protein
VENVKAALETMNTNYQYQQHKLLRVNNWIDAQARSVL